MRQFILRLAVLATLLIPVAVGGSAFATDVFGSCATPAAQATHVCQDAASQSANNTSNPIIHAMASAISIISLIIGIAAVIGVIVSGLRYIISNGDSNAIASARSGLLYSLVGVAVASVAQIVVAFVLNRVS